MIHLYNLHFEGDPMSQKASSFCMINGHVFSWFHIFIFSVIRVCGEVSRFLESKCIIYHIDRYKRCKIWHSHYDDIIMSTTASQITSLTIVSSTVYSGADQRTNQSSASLVFVRGIHRGPVNSPYKWPVTRKMFPFDDVIMMWDHKLLLCWLQSIAPQWI